jgi:hypothetical protein
MPDPPQPARRSLHDAIGYVADRCKCDMVKAGKHVFYALGEGALIAHANVDATRYRHPGSFGYFDNGVQPVPAQLWAGYPWPWFELRALHPRGNPQYREHTADRKNIGPVFNDPTIATADIDSWLGAAEPTSEVSAAGSTAKSTPGRRGRKPGSGMIDDNAAVCAMVHYLAVGAPSIYAAADKAAQDATGQSHESTQRRLARKFRERLGSEPPKGKTWTDIEHELNSKYPTK